MMGEIETAAFLIGAGWVFYKFLKKKNPMHLFLTIFCLLSILSRWPLYLPLQISMGLISITAGVFCFHENYVQEKKASPLAYINIILFVGFGLMFLGESAWKILSNR